MIQYPAINPIAFQIGFLKVHWYGLMYLVGFLGAWLLLNYRAKKRPDLGFNSNLISDIIFYGALGVIVGGRLGYMLFYNFVNFIKNPLLLFKIWDGGMSFHGGCLGVIIALWIFSCYKKLKFFTVMDFIVPVVPIGLAAGRLGNFINGELWGRITDVPWAMIFPLGGPFPRHPSQLYEFFLEGILLFIVLWTYSAKPRPPMAVSALFLIGYGTMRFVVEWFREPDAQLGFIAFDWLTMGELLTMPMILFGLMLWIFAHRSRMAV